jgi:prolipoprotein diacylglyceryltransferase
MDYGQFSTFHPTFLYELIWCTALAIFLMNLPKLLKEKFSAPGDLFAIYVAGYSIGRLWIETLRIDSANLIFGVRLNVWVSLLVLIFALTYLFNSSKKHKKSSAN